VPSALPARDRPRSSKSKGPVNRTSSYAPERIRTSDLRFRRPTLYPAELRAQQEPSLATPRGRRGVAKHRPVWLLRQTCPNGGAGLATVLSRGEHRAVRSGRRRLRHLHWAAVAG